MEWLITINLILSILMIREVANLLNTVNEYANPVFEMINNILKKEKGGE